MAHGSLPLTGLGGVKAGQGIFCRGKLPGAGSIVGKYLHAPGGDGLSLKIGEPVGRSDRQRKQGVRGVGRGVETDPGLAVCAVGSEQPAIENGQVGRIAVFVHRVTHLQKGVSCKAVDPQILGGSAIGCGQKKEGAVACGQTGLMHGLVQPCNGFPGVALQLFQFRGAAAEGQKQALLSGGKIKGAGLAGPGQTGEVALLPCLIEQKCVVVGHIPEGQIYLTLFVDCDFRAAEHAAGGAQALPADAASGGSGVIGFGIAAGHIGDVQCAAPGGDGVVVHIRQKAQRFPGSVLQHGQIQRAVAGTPGHGGNIPQAGERYLFKAAVLGERFRRDRSPAGVRKGIELQLVAGVGQVVSGGHKLAPDGALGQRRAGMLRELGVLPQILSIGLRNADREGHAAALGGGYIRDHNAGICAVREGERALGKTRVRVCTADEGAPAFGGQEGVVHGGPLAALHIAVPARLGAEHIHAGGTEIVAQTVHRGVHPVDDQPGTPDAGVQCVIALGLGLAAHLHHKDLVGIALRADHIGLISRLAGGADGNVFGRLV